MKQTIISKNTVSLHSPAGQTPSVAVRLPVVCQAIISKNTVPGFILQLGKHLQWLRQVDPAVWSGGRGVPNYQSFRDTGSSPVRQKNMDRLVQVTNYSSTDRSASWSRLLTTALQLGLQAGPG